MTTNLANFQLDLSNISNYIYGGNATFTVQSAKTGTRFTYKIQKSEDGKVFFVSVLTGTDNTKDYTHMGLINQDGVLFKTKKSSISQDAPSFRALAWVLNQIKQNKWHVDLEIWASNKCCRCGRKLTSEWAKMGIGPECSSKTA